MGAVLEEGVLEGNVRVGKCLLRQQTGLGRGVAVLGHVCASRSLMAFSEPLSTVSSLRNYEMWR